MNKKKNLLNLFSDTSKYYFHIVKNDIGHLIYVTKEKDEYTADTLEFTKNSIIEGFMDNIEDIGFKKVAHSVYFTDEKNIEKLKYELNDNMEENSDFSDFIENIVDDYRKSEIDDFIEHETDPEAYKKKKDEEYKAQQNVIWEKYKKQVKEQEKAKREAVKNYKNDLIKLLKENLHSTILKKGKKFVLKDAFMSLILNIVPNSEEQGKLWPKRNKQPIVGNEIFNTIEIEKNKIKILLKDRMSKTYIMDFELDSENLNLIKVDESDRDIEIMTDYDFLMKIYNIDVKSKDWDIMYEYDKLNAVIEELIKLHKEENKEEKN